ncbi:remodeling and spacing factor [Anaeramoeba flamelloides]|uniref:Remodeling and spacing factor n=1 Tax=Anaeramoeba flamelloides TaxID=1746091 RepID=A0AAV7YV82_9EUKA|nr:remodeling and spacing factor [Anaeramoeba flamelloides]
MFTKKQKISSCTFYSTLWQFGGFLESTLTTDQIFVQNDMINSFLEKIPKQSDVKKAKKYLPVVWKIFNQNSVVLPYEKKINKRKRKNTNTKKQSAIDMCALERLYTLNPIWRPLMSDPRINEKITPFEPNPSQNSKTVKNFSRKQKTIGLLSLKMCKMLQEKPLTREKIETKTGFIKQRICSVLSVYKMVNLIKEDKITSHLFWDGNQAQILSNLKKYLVLIIKLRNLKRQLCQRVSILVAQYQTKIEEDQKCQIKLEGSKKKKKNTCFEKVFWKLTPFVSTVLEEKVNNIQFKEELEIQNNNFELGLLQKAILVQGLIQKTKVALKKQQLQSDSIIENSKRFISKAPQKKNRRKTRSKRKRIVTKLMRDKKQQQQEQIKNQNQPIQKYEEKNEKEQEQEKEKEQEKENNNEKKTVVQELKESNKEYNASTNFPSRSNFNFNQPTNNFDPQNMYDPNERTVKEIEAIDAILSLTFSTRTQGKKLNNQAYSLIQKKNNHTYTQISPLLLILQQYGNTLSLN